MPATQELRETGAMLALAPAELPKSTCCAGRERWIAAACAPLVPKSRRPHRCGQ